MLYNLIAIDPGGETGIAHAIYNPRERNAAHKSIQTSMKRGSGDCLQIFGEPDEQVLVIKDIIERQILASGQGRQRAYGVRTIVVCEDFVLTPKHRTNSILLPVKIAAKLEFYLWLEYTDDQLEFRWQMPNEMKAITDDQLRRWNMWMPGRKNDDAVAALKHLIVLARKLEKETND